MINKYGKLFKKISTNEVVCFKYDINQNYYSFVQEIQKEGYHQCIVTSDIMIKIIQYFIEAKYLANPKAWHYRLM